MRVAVYILTGRTAVPERALRRGAAVAHFHINYVPPDSAIRIAESLMEKGVGHRALSEVRIRGALGSSEDSWGCRAAIS